MEMRGAAARARTQHAGTDCCTRRLRKRGDCEAAPSCQHKADSTRQNLQAVLSARAAGRIARPAASSRSPRRGQRHALPDHHQTVGTGKQLPPIENASGKRAAALMPSAVGIVEHNLANGEPTQASEHTRPPSQLDVGLRTMHIPDFSLRPSAMDISAVVARGGHASTTAPVPINRTDGEWRILVANFRQVRWRRYSLECAASAPTLSNQATGTNKLLSVLRPVDYPELQRSV